MVAGDKNAFNKKETERREIISLGIKVCSVHSFPFPHPLIVFIPIFLTIFSLSYLLWLSFSTTPISFSLFQSFFILLFSLSLFLNLFPFCVSNICYFSLIAFSFISSDFIAISLPLCCLCFFPSLSVDKHCYSDEDSRLVCYPHNIMVFVL